jgi:serine/threonine-protein kinase
VIAIARGVCDSVGEAHARGIVHRDLKPENIHLERRGDDESFVKVLDFGIAKNQHSAVEEGADLTQVGQMIGTFCYMAPEQMIGTCTPESDVFTLGIVIYELIAGHRPYGDAKGPAAQLAAVLGDTPAPLTGVPVTLAEIVARCIDKDPLRRYRDAGELGDALARLVDNPDDQPTTFAPAYRTPPWLSAANPAVTIHGVVPARGSTPMFDRPRIASGTSPIVERLAPPRPVTETGQIYDPSNRLTILISLVIALAAIALGLLL